MGISLIFCMFAHIGFPTPQPDWRVCGHHSIRIAIAANEGGNRKFLGATWSTKSGKANWGIFRLSSNFDLDVVKLLAGGKYPNMLELADKLSSRKSKILSFFDNLFTITPHFKETPVANICKEIHTQ